MSAGVTIYTMPLQNAMQQQMKDLHTLQSQWEEGRRKVLAASSGNALQKLPFLDKPCHGTAAVATMTSPPAFWHSVGDHVETAATGMAGESPKPILDDSGLPATLDTPPKVRKVSDFLMKYMCKYEPSGGAQF